MTSIISSSSESRVREETIHAKEQWLKLVYEDNKIRFFCRLFVDYLDLQRTITAIEASMDTPDKVAWVQGIRDCLTTLIDEISRPIYQMEMDNDRRAREREGA